MKKVVGLYAIQKKSDVASASASTFEPTLCGMWVAHTSGRRRSGASSRVESKGSFDSVRYEYTRVFVFVSLCVCVCIQRRRRDGTRAFHFTSSVVRLFGGSLTRIGRPSGQTNERTNGSGRRDATSWREKRWGRCVDAKDAKEPGARDGI